MSCIASTNTSQQRQLKLALKECLEKKGESAKAQAAMQNALEARDHVALQREMQSAAEGVTQHEASLSSRVVVDVKPSAQPVVSLAARLRGEISLSSMIKLDVVSDKISALPVVKSGSDDNQWLDIDQVKMLITTKEEQKIVQIRIQRSALQFQALLQLDFNSLRSLTTLDLSCNKIGIEGCRHLSVGFEHLRSLTSLNLNGELSSWNKIDDEGCRHLSIGFEHLRSLTTLDLSSNEIGDEGCRI